MMPIMAGTMMYLMPKKMSLNPASQVPMPLDAVSSLIGTLLKFFGSLTIWLSRSNASLVGSRTQIRLMHFSAIGWTSPFGLFTRSRW